MAIEARKEGKEVSFFPALATLVFGILAVLFFLFITFLWVLNYSW